MSAINEHKDQLVRFQVLTAENMKMTVFWDMVMFHMCALPLQHMSTSVRLHGTIFQKAVISRQLDIQSHKNVFGIHMHTHMRVFQRMR
jgi:hypothetical protein